MAFNLAYQCWLWFSVGAMKGPLAPSTGQSDNRTGTLCSYLLLQCCGTLWRDCSSGTRKLRHTYPSPCSGHEHLARLMAPHFPIHWAQGWQETKIKLCSCFCSYLIMTFALEVHKTHIFFFRTRKLLFNWIKQPQVASPVSKENWGSLQLMSMDKNTLLVITVKWK